MGKYHLSFTQTNANIVVFKAKAFSTANSYVPIKKRTDCPVVREPVHAAAIHRSISVTFSLELQTLIEACRQCTATSWTMFRGQRSCSQQSRLCLTSHVPLILVATVVVGFKHHITYTCPTFTPDQVTSHDHFCHTSSSSHC